MNILILGASSYIGQSLASAFSFPNKIFLVGRNEERLSAVVGTCRQAGAVGVEVIVEDFSVGVNRVLEVLHGKNVDLIIDAASASSKKRDSDLLSNDIEGYIVADCISHMRIVDHFVKRQREAPAVIFVSTVLALVKSPDRAIYSALKTICEVFFTKLSAERAGFKLMIVYVGTIIPTDRESAEGTKLGARVFEAFCNGRRRVFFGFSGLFLLSLFYIQPLLFYAVTQVQRRIRKVIRKVKQ